MKSLLITAGLFVLLVGCMGPKQEEYYWAHFGPYPTNYDQTITAWVENSFDAPRSIHISAPVRARVPNRLLQQQVPDRLLQEVPKRLLHDDTKVYAWCAGVSLEEKDAFDRYTPRKYFHVYLREGDIVTASIKTPEPTRTEGIAHSGSTGSVSDAQKQSDRP
jgi:hypothetical protein